MLLSAQDSADSIIKGRMMEEKKSFRELRLVKKSKKGIAKVIFGRTGINLILIMLQLAFYFSALSALAVYLPFLISTSVFIQIVMIFVVMNSREDFNVKLAWISLTAILPIYAFFMYFFIKNDIGHRQLKKYTTELLNDSYGLIKNEKSFMDDLKVKNRRLYNLADYVNSGGLYPIHKNTGSKYYALGDLMFPDMINELKKAEKFIFIEYFIIEEGNMWGQVLAILEDKVKQGVEVRVVYDGMCEFSMLPYNYKEELKKIGIKTRIFSRILPFISTAYNYRNHRKLLIIDGKTAFTGGINMADEYINKIERFGHWKDAGIRIKGEAVRNFTLMFLQDWTISISRRHKRKLGQSAKLRYGYETEFAVECGQYVLTPVENEKETDGYLIPFGDNPLDSDKVGEMVYIDILNRAEEYVYIMTPYLIVDEAMSTALKYAARKGVRVRIMTPRIPDKKFVFAQTRSHYRDLMDAGVEIYEYMPGFVHSKIFVSDDKRAVTGSINLDYRSLYHSFENAVYLESADYALDVRRDFEETLKSCERISYSFLKNDSIFNKVTGALLKPVSYLM